MNRKMGLKWVLMMAALLIFVAGCGLRATPQETIQGALEKTMGLKSYTFSTSVNLDELTLPEAFLENEGPEGAMVLGLLQNLKIDMNGTYQAEPMRMEVTADIALSGDLSFNLTVPMVFTKEKFWIKVPKIPMVPMGEVAGKFVEIDLEELAKQEEMKVPAYNPELQQKLVQDVTSIVLKHLDSKQYFQQLSKEELKALPEGLELNKAIKVSVNQSNFESAVLTFMEKSLPEILDMLAGNESYMKILDVTKEDIESSKKELSGEDAEVWKKGLEEMKKELTINEFSLVGGIHKNYLTYQDVKADMSFMVDGDPAKLVLSIVNSYANLNEAVEFKIEVPEDQIITMDELRNQGSQLEY